LIVIAFTFDAAPLFVPGVAFALLGLLVPAWVLLSASGTSLERRLHTDRVVEDEPLEATIDVRRGLLGPPGAEIDDPLAGDPVPMTRALSLIRGARSASVHIVARFPRRGLRTLPAPSLVVQDALGLARLTRAASTAPQELLVLPRTERVRWGERGAGDRTRALAGARANDPLAAVEIDGLRPYRPGTPASRIHWPALARGSGLLERRLQADADTRPLVVLDTRGEGPIEHLDAAVRAAASLTLELARRGGCGLLLPGERRPITIEPELLSWPPAHARLALVRGGAGIRPPVLGPGTASRPVFYVAAQALDRLPVGLSAGHRGSVIIVPRAVSGRISGRLCFEVAGCCGFALCGAGRSTPGASRPTATAGGAAQAGPR
jgi:uncharacterized protein (DUF58 family)